MAVSPSVSIEDVAKKLHVSRNYIHKSILPYVRHEKTAQYRVRIDEGELRLWLKENASFSRQTILVPYERLDEYCSMLEKLRIDSKVPPPTARRKLPFRYVEPFDFWDEELIFPDDKRFAHAESFYRAMYTCGAIKIKLGERKAIFCAPLLSETMDEKDFPEDSEGLPPYSIETKQGDQFLVVGGELCPAVDEGHAAEKARKQAEKEHNIFIDIKGEDPYTQAIADFLRHICNDSRDEQLFQVEYSKNRATAHITVPKDVVDRRMYPEKWEDAMRLAEGIFDEENPSD